MLKVGSCFSGIGCWELGLKYLEIEHSQEFCIEYDKYPYASYKAIHGDIKNYNDVTKVEGDEVEDIDLFTYSPPCQAFSIAGKGLGVDDHRGVLFFDALRIIQHKQPKLCIMENVKGLVGKKHKETFESILQCLTLAGYTNYWKVLNTKNYGIPQNRERVFIVSIRNDIDKGFEFPAPFDNGLRLKDLLEDEVDEKFYLTDDSCLSANAALAPTDNTIKILQATKQGFIECEVGGVFDNSFPDSKTRRGRVQENGQICPTLQTSNGIVSG